MCTFPSVIRYFLENFSFKKYSQRYFGWPVCTVSGWREQTKLVREFEDKGYCLCPWPEAENVLSSMGSFFLTDTKNTTKCLGSLISDLFWCFVLLLLHFFIYYIAAWKLGMRTWLKVLSRSRGREPQSSHGKPAGQTSSSCALTGWFSAVSPHKAPDCCPSVCLPFLGVHFCYLETLFATSLPLWTCNKPLSTNQPSLLPL